MPQAPLDPILSRQLRRLGIPESDPPQSEAQWDALLERVSRTYEESRQSRYLVERSLSIVSTEMQELYAQVERSANQRLERFFERAPDLFCLAGFDGHLTMVNPAWERVLGVAVDELLADPFIELVHPEDRDATAAVLDAAVPGPCRSWCSRTASGTRRAGGCPCGGRPSPTSTPGSSTRAAVTSRGSPRPATCR